MTVIASQAVISGAFAVTRQAIRLGLLPRVAIKHTSRREEGQIYLPMVNWVLFLAVMVLVLLFSSSTRLANAYGLAVTGTLVLESVLFLLFAVLIWHWSWWKVATYIATVGVLEVVLLAANTTKLIAGGWLPLLIAAVVVLVMTTWKRGSEQVAASHRRLEGSLSSFVRSIPRLPISRPAGVAVFPHDGSTTTPLAMIRCATDLHVLHDRVVIVRLVHAHAPHVDVAERFSVEDIRGGQGDIVHVTVRVGFTDDQNIPRNLALAADLDPRLTIDHDHALYFLSVLTLRPPRASPVRSWRQRLFLAMEKNQVNRTEVLHLPPDRTIVLGSELHL